MVGHEQRPAVRGNVLHPLGLHAPPAFVEEPEERLHQLGEVLVEPPLVLGVIALEPAQRPVHRLAALTRKGAGGPGQGLGQLEAGVEALAHPAQERDRPGVDHAAAAPTQSSTAATVAWRGRKPTSSTSRRVSTPRP